MVGKGGRVRHRLDWLTTQLLHALAPVIWVPGALYLGHSQLTRYSAPPFSLAWLPVITTLVSFTQLEVARGAWQQCWAGLRDEVGAVGAVLLM